MKVRIITLVENTTSSVDYQKRHGICFYIETEHHRILFDLGPDDSFLENAKKLNVDIAKVDLVIISHGHADHGGALELLLQNNSIAKIYVRREAFKPHYIKILFLKIFVGLDPALCNEERMIFTDNECVIDEELYLFADVQGRRLLPEFNKVLLTKTEGGYVKDDFSHEQNLIISQGSKKILLGGCAHNGIVNILKRAEEHAGKIDYVISGLHLFNPTIKKYVKPQIIKQVARILMERETIYYTCHCTGPKAFSILKEEMGN